MQKQIRNVYVSESKESKQLASERRYQFGISISFVITCSILIYSIKKYNLTVYNAASLLNAVIQIHFWLSFFKILASCHKLYHIRIRRRMSPFGIGNLLSVPSGIESDIYERLDSVSALIGLRGSNVEKLVSMLIYLQLGSQLIVLIRNLINTDTYFYTNILGIISIIGYWIILTYSVERNWKADRLHYLGVVLAFGGSFIGFMISHNYSTLSLLIVITAGMNVILYGVVATLKFKKEQIYFRSMVMLLSESNVIILSAIVGSLYTYDLTDE